MTKEKKYNVVYITTNLVNGKQYIGDHCSDNLNDNYLGSGSYIQKAIKKYGKQNFKRKILESFHTNQEAFNAQEKYINEYNTLAPNGYNISPKGGHQVKQSVSEETKQKMKNSAKYRPIQSEETKIKRRKSLKGHIVAQETREKSRKSNKGKKRSKETRENIRKSKLNMSEETKYKISVNTKLTMQRPEVKQKLHTNKKNKPVWNKGINYATVTCPYCNKEMKKSSNFSRYHNENCKHKNNE